MTTLSVPCSKLFDLVTLVSSNSNILNATKFGDSDTNSKINNSCVLSADFIISDSLGSGRC